MSTVHWMLPSGLILEAGTWWDGLPDDDLERQFWAIAIEQAVPGVLNPEQLGKLAATIAFKASGLVRNLEAYAAPLRLLPEVIH